MTYRFIFRNANDVKEVVLLFQVEHGKQGLVSTATIQDSAHCEGVRGIVQYCGPQGVRFPPAQIIVDDILHDVGKISMGTAALVDHTHHTEKHTIEGSRYHTDPIEPKRQSKSHLHIHTYIVHTYIHTYSI